MSCFFDYGTQEEPIRAQITYLGSQKKLTVALLGSPTSSWVACTSLFSEDLPVGYYLGLTAATSEQAASHDIFSMVTTNLKPAQKLPEILSQTLLNQTAPSQEPPEPLAQEQAQNTAEQQRLDPPAVESPQQEDTEPRDSHNASQNQEQQIPESHNTTQQNKNSDATSASPQTQETFQTAEQVPKPPTEPEKIEIPMGPSEQDLEVVKQYQELTRSIETFSTSFSTWNSKTLESLIILTAKQMDILETIAKPEEFSLSTLLPYFAGELISNTHSLLMTEITQNLKSVLPSPSFQVNIDSVKTELAKAANDGHVLVNTVRSNNLEAAFETPFVSFSVWAVFLSLQVLGILAFFLWQKYST